MGALVVIMLFVLVAGIAFLTVLRSMGLEEQRTYARLHDPHVPTVAYAVPDGVDPAVVLAAVHAAGFTSVVGETAPAEHLLVGCGDADRPRLRSVIEAIPLTRYDGTPIRDRVVFEDER